MLSQLRRSALSVARRSIVPSVAPPRVLSALIIPARAFTQGLAPAYFDRGDRPERPARFSRDNDSRGPGRQFGERTQETNTVFLSPFPVKSTKEDIQQFLRENGITDFKHIDISKFCHHFHLSKTYHPPLQPQKRDMPPPMSCSLPASGLKSALAL